MAGIAKLKQSMWLENVNQSLYFRVPGRRRRQIIQELKANLAEATAEVGPEEALKQFGPARDLVDSYLDTDRGRFDLAIALAAGLGVWLLWSLIGGIVWVTAWETRDAIEQTAHLHRTYFGLWEIDIAADGKGTSMTSTGPFILITSLIAFLVGGRIWNVFRRRSPKDAS